MAKTINVRLPPPGQYDVPGEAYLDHPAELVDPADGWGFPLDEKQRVVHRLWKIEDHYVRTFRAGREQPDQDTLQINVLCAWSDEDGHMLVASTGKPLDHAPTPGEAGTFEPRLKESFAIAGQGARIGISLTAAGARRRLEDVAAELEQEEAKIAVLFTAKIEAGRLLEAL